MATLGTLAIRNWVPAWTLGLISIASTIAYRSLGEAAGLYGTLSLSECFVLLILIVMSFRRAASPRDWVAVALIVVALLSMVLRLMGPDALSFLILLIAAAGCALAAGALLRNLDGERRLALAVATQQERDRLARDLHDDFTNRVTSMILMVQAIRRSRGTSDTALDNDLMKIETAGSEALGSMRRWVATLRASNVERDRELGALPPAEIRLLLDQWEATSSDGRVLFVDKTRGVVPEETATIVHRIVQEAVTNVSRHAADASWLKVSITEDGDDVVVEIVNPVAGALACDPVPGSGGLGIIGMKERARHFGGTVQAGPAGSSTWSVRATIPRDAVT